MANFVALRNCFTVTPQKKTLRFTKGQKVSQARFDSFTKSFQKNFVSARQARSLNSSRLSWLTEELVAVVDSYERHFDHAAGTCSLKAVEADFAADPRFQDRKLQGVGFVVGQVKHLDSLYSGVGFDSVLPALRDLLLARNPERYCLSEAEQLEKAADALLAELLA